MLNVLSILLCVACQLSCVCLCNCSKIVCSENHECPTWFSCTEDHHCKCGNYTHHIVKCNEVQNTSEVLDTYCVTYNVLEDKTVAGACFVNSGNNLTQESTYTLLPGNVSTLNEFMCASLNRTGPLCGQCIQGHSPLVYSFNLTCVPCKDGHKNWWKYLLVGFLPLTMFYLFMIAIKVNITSSHLNSYIFYCQIITMPMHLRIIFKATNQLKSVHIIARILASIYGIWNLDFFRPLLPHICLNTTPLQTLTLDYTIAVYPLGLIALSCLLIKLYDKGYKCVTIVWRPFRHVFRLFQKNWNIQTSILDSFATFFLLSYVKVLSVSAEILLPTNLYTKDSNDYTAAVYYDGSVKYFSKEHLPFAILAICMLTFYVVVPTLILFCYPFRCFQKILNCIPIRWHILHTFVDSFQGCFKDGTEEGTKDCRWFAGLFLLVRIMVLSLYGITHTAAFYALASILTLILIFLLLFFQPYKSRVCYYLRINTVFLILLLLFSISVCGTILASAKANYLVYFFLATSTTSIFIPLFYISYIMIRWLFSHRKCGKEMFQRFQAWRLQCTWLPLRNQIASEETQLLYQESHQD